MEHGSTKAAGQIQMVKKTLPFAKLVAVCGEKNVIPGAAAGDKYLCDFLRGHRGRAQAVLMPQTTAQVAALVKLCGETATPLVAQGGNTGYRAGGVPDDSGRAVVLSMEKMRKPPEINRSARMMTVAAGCVLEELQNAATAEGLFLPLNLGAKGSCQIGGNLATNAGGMRFLRYGGARELCLGLEAVLPDGAIVNLLSGLRKNNAGYDIKNLLIGSEGTLGVITAATLKLLPPPAHRAAAFVAVSTVEAALLLLHHCQQATGGQMESFELIPHLLMRLLQKHFPQTPLPFAAPPPLAVLMEAAAAEESVSGRLQAALAEALANKIITDAVIPSSEKQRCDFWQLRELIPEATRREGRWLKLDVALPLQNLPAFVEAVEHMLDKDKNGVHIVAFGHLGDGNLHLSLRPQGGAPEDNLSLAAAIKARVLEAVQAHGGTFSAEHGIGRSNVAALWQYQDKAALAAMRAVKTALDPHNIMNPGVMFADG